jgi:hypothetical protein
MTEFQRNNFDVIVFNLILSVIVLPFGIFYAVCYLPYRLANLLLIFMGEWKQDLIQAYVNDTKLPKNVEKESAEDKTYKEILQKAGLDWIEKQNKK